MIGPRMFGDGFEHATILRTPLRLLMSCRDGRSVAGAQHRIPVRSRETSQRCDADRTSREAALESTFTG
jgi:hypothetical protein